MDVLLSSAKEINRLISKRMSSICLSKISAIEKKWCSQTFDFRRYHRILKLLVAIKNQRSGSKSMCGFFILIWKEIK